MKREVSVGMWDVLIRDVTVADGSGGPLYKADVGVQDGKIGAIDAMLSLGDEAERVIDARGLVLSPGFIDMHSHSDIQIITNPELTPKVAQGVTTEVLGQDGLSYAPVDDGVLGPLRKQLAGWNGNPPGFDWSWRTVRDYLKRLDEGIAVNIAYLVPHGTVRALVMGWRNRKATPAELERMCGLIDEGMTEGAFGMSSGLTYTPGMYASTDELTALCRVVAQHGGYYSPHHRGYGRNALQNYTEMLDVSQRSACPLHLTHASLNYSVNRGMGPRLIQILDAALEDGCDLSIDSHPYLTSATYLAALLPSWAADGGTRALLNRLNSQKWRERIRIEMEEIGADGAYGVPIDWEKTVVSGVREPQNETAVGCSIGEIARHTGCTPADTYFKLLITDRLGTSCLMHNGNEENVQVIMQHSTHTAGSDGLLIGDRPHPRAWGTFPRYLRRYVRELGLLSLEECVAHLTGRPARRLHLKDRGLVRRGYAADLVLFDPDTVQDLATFEEPRQLPVGIPYVFVNGVAAIDDGRPTGAMAGRVLRQGSGER